MKLIMVLISTVFLYQTAFAQELVIYPARGQSNQQMEKDKFECFSWARGQTGFDPTVPPQITTVQPESGSVAGGTARGGLRGAAVGAGIGAITGGGSGAGRGAGIGALTGGTFGSLRSRSQNERSRQAVEQSAQQQWAQYAQRRDAYNRAYSACLEGRGYTVR